MNLSTEQKTAIINRLLDYVCGECSAIDTECAFDESFDSLNEDSLPPWLSHLSPSAVFKEMCPTDYRCAVADYSGTNTDWTEVRGELYELAKLEESRDAFVAELRDEMDEARAEVTPNGRPNRKPRTATPTA
jgi:hypothetical protein